MRVLIANKFFYRNGGSEVVMFQERDYLKANGVEVVDFSMEDPRNFESPYSSHFVRHRAYSGNGGGPIARGKAALELIHSREAVRKMTELIDRERPDIVHCHNIYHQLTPSIIGAAKRKGLPVVLTLHDYKPVCPVYTRLRDGHVCSDCLEGNFFKVITNRCADGSLGRSTLLLLEAVTQKMLGNYEAVDVVLAPSRFMAEAVIGHRFEAHKVRVLPNGVDVESIRAATADHDYLLYMGRITREKGIETLLKAHARMDADIKLLIAGTGPLEKELRTKYPNVKFLGYVAGGELADVVARASAVVVPSEWYENCPMSVLEAMAYGKPVIASEIGGIPELVVNMQTGLLFAPGDASALQTCMEKIMHNRDLRAEFGRAARRRAEEKFSLKTHDEQLMRTYAELTSLHR
jgi:glycosyltransferase involved in cell wall biosynthesis